MRYGMNADADEMRRYIESLVGELPDSDSTTQPVEFMDLEDIPDGPIE